MGILTKGFETKILSLAKRMKGRMNRDYVGATCVRGRAVLSKFEREIKRLQCFVQFIEKGKGSGRGRNREEVGTAFGFP